MDPNEALNSVLRSLVAASKAESGEDAREAVNEADAQWQDLMGWVMNGGWPAFIRLNKGSDADFYCPRRIEDAKGG